MMSEPQQLATTAAAAPTDRPHHRRRLLGRVTSDRRDKTIAVLVERRVKVYKYGKYIQRRTTMHVHDERNEAHEGDTVEIAECRPISRQKHWRLVRVVRRLGGEVPR